MGYPNEIPNAMPGEPPLPPENPVTSFRERVSAMWNRWFGRKKTCRADKPKAYGQRTQKHTGSGAAQESS